MLKTTVHEIVEAVQGKLLSGSPEQCITAVETDSRICGAGMLFVPLIAARDGHDFIGKALEGGAEGTLCSRVPEHFADGKFYIQVEDTRLALKALASWYRDQFQIPYVQITGSVGKTTTKEMIAAVLAEQFCTLKTDGNFNNDIGVPKTLFRLQPEHEVAVVESGMNHFDEIRYLGEMIRPDIAVISNVGDAHIENLGSREGILKAKSEIFENLKTDGIAVLNGDDVMLNTLNLPFRTYRCGEGENCNVKVTAIEDLGVEGIRCTVTTEHDSYPVEIPAPGRHMIYSAAMAVIIGELLGVAKEKIIVGISHYEPAGERMRLIRKENGALILSDCYNANPQSMAAAIVTLTKAGCEKTVAVLGDMGELGAISQQAHYDMGSCCAEKKVDVVVAIGEKAEKIAQGAREGGCGCVHWFKTKEEACELLAQLMEEHTALLVKASHAMQFQKIVQYLESRD